MAGWQSVRKSAYKANCHLIKIQFELRSISLAELMFDQKWDLSEKKLDVPLRPVNLELTGTLKFRFDCLTTDSFLVFFFPFSFFRSCSLVPSVCLKCGLHALKASAGTPLSQCFLRWVLLAGHSLSNCVCSFHLQPLCSTQHKLQGHLAARHLFIHPVP